MGVRPSAVDIGLYNLWAARHGQPRFGNHPPNVVVAVAAAAAPAAPAAPVPPAPPPQGWQRGRARAIPRPVPHGVLAQAAQHPGDKWRRGTKEEGTRNTVAWLVSGKKFTVIRRNNQTREDVVTPRGRDYFEHNRQEFIFKIPVVGYKYDGPRTIECFRSYMPITEEYMASLAHFENHH